MVEREVDAFGDPYEREQRIRAELFSAGGDDCFPASRANPLILARVAAERIAKLESLLSDCREEISDFEDVRDGSDGAPSPNWAMSLIAQIDSLLDVRQEGGDHG